MEDFMLFSVFFVIVSKNENEKCEKRREIRTFVDSIWGMWYNPTSEAPCFGEEKRRNPRYEGDETTAGSLRLVSAADLRTAHQDLPRRIG